MNTTTEQSEKIMRQALQAIAVRPEDIASLPAGWQAEYLTACDKADAAIADYAQYVSEPEQDDIARYYARVQRVRAIATR